MTDMVNIKKNTKLRSSGALKDLAIIFIVIIIIFILSYNFNVFMSILLNFNPSLKSLSLNIETPAFTKHNSLYSINGDFPAINNNTIEVLTINNMYHSGAEHIKPSLSFKWFKKLSVLNIMNMITPGIRILTPKFSNRRASCRS